MQLLIQWIPQTRLWLVSGPRGTLGSIKWDGTVYRFTPKGRRLTSAAEVAEIYKFIRKKARRRKGGKRK